VWALDLGPGSGPWIWALDLGLGSGPCLLDGLGCRRSHHLDQAVVLPATPPSRAPHRQRPHADAVQRSLMPIVLCATCVGSRRHSEACSWQRTARPISSRRPPIGSARGCSIAQGRPCPQAQWRSPSPAPLKSEEATYFAAFCALATAERG